MKLPRVVQNVLNSLGFVVTQSEHAVALIKDLADRLSPDHLREMAAYLDAKLKEAAPVLEAIDPAVTPAVNAVEAALEVVAKPTPIVTG